MNCLCIAKLFRMSACKVCLGAPRVVTADLGLGANHGHFVPDSTQGALCQSFWTCFSVTNNFFHQMSSHLAHPTHPFKLMIHQIFLQWRPPATASHPLASVVPTASWFSFAAFLWNIFSCLLKALFFQCLHSSERKTKRWMDSILINENQGTQIREGCRQVHVLRAAHTKIIHPMRVILLPT